MHYHAGDSAPGDRAARAGACCGGAGQRARNRSWRSWPASSQARRTAVALYREALSEAEGDDALQATIHLRLAGLMRFTEGIERGIEHGELAVRAASRVDDSVLRCCALAAYGLMHFNAGRGIPTRAMDEALSLERSLSEWPLDDGPTWVFGWQLVLVGGRSIGARTSSMKSCPSSRRGTTPQERRRRCGS